MVFITIDVFLKYSTIFVRVKLNNKETKICWNSIIVIKTKGVKEVVIKIYVVNASE